jgi:hypothetical protein
LEGFISEEILKNNDFLREKCFYCQGEKLNRFIVPLDRGNKTLFA